MKKLAQIKALISLALIDGSLEENEKNFIFKVGEESGISKEIINELIDLELECKEEKSQKFDLEISENKFEYLVNLVKLMKADGEVFESELRYCEKASEKLGYSRVVLSVLSKLIHSSDSKIDVEELKEDIESVL